MSIHKPVLLKESLEGLNLKNGNIVVDATLGGGGHSVAILSKIFPDGKLVAIDADKEAIERFQFLISPPRVDERFPRVEAGNSEFLNKHQLQKSEIEKNIILASDNFANLKNILRELKIEKVDAIIADLGLSSDQIENAERGFSFQKDSELDMRMDQESQLTAKEVVNTYSKEDLEKILWEYGEEKYAGMIAEKIVEKRKVKALVTTFELVKAIDEIVPEKYKHQKIHQATRTFQALRIEVNGELDNLKEFISQAIELLKLKGRLVIISFHSLEDRIVKNIFRENARGCICPPASLREALRTGPPEKSEFLYGFKRRPKPTVKIITKKPVMPSEEEIRDNPRSRSAKLRIIERI
ncbi:ribosomal RNA small subunit methyltransferase H [bacterium BMS3Abin15]|nr:ribosomal RNA small subunit methyltransferase H [bacterium BMS3Abin15]